MRYIASKDNLTIKQAIKLKDKKYRCRDGMFLMEGRNNVTEAIKRQDLLIRIFIENGREEEYDSLLQKNPQIEWISVDKKLLDMICDTEHPQGIAAVMRIPQANLVNLTKQASLLLLLDQLSDPGNLGTIIRTARAFSVDGILMSRNCADPFSPKVVRASMGGVLNIPIYSDIDIMDIERLRCQGYILYCSSPSAKDDLYDLNLTGRSIIVIGNEARGVSNKIKSLCQHQFKIPHDSQVESLNAAIACAIILGEAFRQRRPSLF
ncbi:TrmH family RNA methyltransferase [Syntrophomonas palmitatica]|uniref:TrmH family RNA methyltransferase n=1 Tax=Syntrophomonas palmitatica TaxID=402877 RepID=UPI0006CF72FD|nr:RNA methyltransferase [Syntrophomonas palmitatica]